MRRGSEGLKATPSQLKISKVDPLKILKAIFWLFLGGKWPNFWEIGRILCKNSKISRIFDKSIYFFQIKKKF
jgi:hypothetical protein